MSENRADKRRFTRVALDVPVDIHQGGSVWHQRLIDISLTGVATDQPDVWDAQYNEPFTICDSRVQLYVVFVLFTVQKCSFTASANKKCHYIQSISVIVGRIACHFAIQR